MRAIQSMKMTSTDQNFTFTLKAGKDKRYVLMFTPYPKDQPIAQLVRSEEMFTFAGIK